MLLDSEEPGKVEILNSVIGTGYRNEGFDVDLCEVIGNNNEISKRTYNCLGLSKEKSQEQDNNPSRDQWVNSGFLMSCISMSVGLGNVWRFPFTCLQNGGGAFLIPYLIVLVLVGRPIYFMEMCLGQFSSFGPIRIWNICGALRGVGYGMMLGCACVVSFYCSIMAITVYYLVVSVGPRLPWSVCNPDWGEEYCTSNGTFIGSANTSLSQLYYEKTAFPQKDNIDDGIGWPNWKLSVCLLFSWLFTFITLAKGVRSSGRVAYFTALFPYVVIIILLIRGVTLDGSWKGILYFITPQWNKLIEPKVWFAAISQCFFSLATGFGTITMFSSYNPFRHNIYKDVVIISFMDTLTSLLAGFTIFGVLGHLASQMQVDIEDVAKGGPGLIFVYYPEALANFEYMPQIFALLFFGMMFCLGIGSVAALAGCIVTVICDEFPKWIRWKVTSWVCILGFFSGLIYLSPGGGFMLTLVGYYGTDFIIYLYAMIEVFGVSWIYGLNNFCLDIEFMLGIKIGLYWRICWKFIIPLGLFSLLVYITITSKELTYEGATYPLSAIVSGYVLLGIGMLLLPVYAIYTIWTKEAPTLKEKFASSFQPSEEWGPADSLMKTEWILFKKCDK